LESNPTVNHQPTVSMTVKIHIHANFASTSKGQEPQIIKTRVEGINSISSYLSNIFLFVSMGLISYK
jgi:hypothetical protein